MLLGGYEGRAHAPCGVCGMRWVSFQLTMLKCSKLLLGAPTAAAGSLQNASNSASGWPLTMGVLLGFPLYTDRLSLFPPPTLLANGTGPHSVNGLPLSQVLRFPLAIGAGFLE